MKALKIAILTSWAIFITACATAPAIPVFPIEPITVTTAEPSQYCEWPDIKIEGDSAYLTRDGLEALVGCQIAYDERTQLVATNAAIAQNVAQAHNAAIEIAKLRREVALYRLEREKADKRSLFWELWITRGLVIGLVL